MLQTCFICGSPVTNPDSPRPRARKRGRPTKIKDKNLSSSEDLNFNCSFNEVGLSANVKTLLKHLLGNYDTKNSIYNDIDNLANLQTGGGKLKILTFCGDCDKLARDIGNLELELEVIQMRLVEKVRLARDAVIRSYSESQQGILREEVPVTVAAVLDKEEDFLEVFRKFQSFVAGNDSIGKRIPLIYLGKLKIPERSLSKDLVMKSQLQSQSPCVKAEPMEDDECVEEGALDFDFESEDYDDEWLIHDNARRKQVKKLEVDLDLATDDCIFKETSLPEDPSGRKPRLKDKSKSKPKKRASQVSNKGKLRNPRKGRRGRPKQPNKPKLPRIYRKHICEICNFETKTVSRMEQHFREHEDKVESNSSERTFKCSHCDLNFVHSQPREFHEKLHTLFTVKCELCEAMIIILNLKEHLELVHNETAHSCNHCSLCFPSIVSMARHCINHKGYKLSCNECQPPRIIGGARQFLRHLADEHNQTDFLIPCDVPSCSKMFVDIFEKFGHRNFHEEKFKCEKCDKLFPHRTALEIHNVTIHEHDKKPFQCNICMEKFVHKSGLHKHRIVKHSESMIPCHLCSEKFICRNSLRRHIQKRHDDSGTSHRFACPVENCGKKYINRSELKRHQLAHSTVNQFTCEVCGFSTKTEELLKTHAKLHGDKTHICSFCGKGFTLAKYLTNHVRIHTGEKPFLCSVCGAAFNQRGSLHMHRKRHKETLKTE